MIDSQNLPELALAEWQDTYATLHRWVQIVGKTRAALAPMQNHWWHVTLYVSTAGLRTSPMPYANGTAEVEFDFLRQELIAHTSNGARRSMPLRAQPTSAFYQAYTEMLQSLDVVASIWPVPSELPDRLPFTEDNVHCFYDGDSARRCWRCLVFADRVFKEFRGRFLGKCSPSHFWWGSFDLACTRFSGRRAPPHPGGIPNLPDAVTREAYSHECMSVGWWPGSIAGLVSEPAFYAYAYPEPAGCAVAPVAPTDAYYHPELHEWILPYDALRQASDPEREVLLFCQSTYEVAARLGNWDRVSLERDPKTSTS